MFTNEVVGSNNEYKPLTVVKYGDKARWICICKSGPENNWKSREVVQCSKCLSWSHTFCMGLSRITSERLKSTRFWCPGCEPTRLIVMFMTKHLNKDMLFILRILNAYMEVIKDKLAKAKEMMENERTIESKKKRKARSPSLHISFPVYKRRKKHKDQSPSQVFAEYRAFEEEKNKVADQNYAHKIERKIQEQNVEFRGVYAESREVRGIVRYFCPIGSVSTQYRCNSSVNSEFKGWVRPNSLVQHVQQHCRAGQFHMVPKRYWQKSKKKYCEQCKVICAISTKTHKTHKSKGQHSIMKPKVKNKSHAKKNDHKEKSKIMVVDVDYGLPSFDEIWRYFLPTIHNIPGKLINEWAEIVEKILDELTTLPREKTINAWKKLFMVSRCLWTRTRSGKKDGRKRKMTRLLKRINLWNENKIVQLWNSFKQEAIKWERRSMAKLKTQSGSPTRTNVDDVEKMEQEKAATNKCKDQGQQDDLKKKDEEYRKRRREFLIRNNDISSATNTMTSNGLCMLDDSVQKQLKEKLLLKPPMKSMRKKNTTLK